MKPLPYHELRKSCVPASYVTPSVGGFCEKTEKMRKTRGQGVDARRGADQDRY